jgi:hypothetical protein
MRAVPSTLYQRLRFPTLEGIMEIRGDQVAAKQCLIVAAHQKAVAVYGPERINSNHRTGGRMMTVPRRRSVLKS